MTREKEHSKSQWIASVHIVHIFLFVLQSFSCNFLACVKMWVRFVIFLWLNYMSQYFRLPLLVWASVTHHLTKAVWLVSQFCHSTNNSRRHLFWLKKIISGEENQIQWEYARKHSILFENTTLYCLVISVISNYMKCKFW